METEKGQGEYNQQNPGKLMVQGGTHVASGSPPTSASRGIGADLLYPIPSDVTSRKTRYAGRGTAVMVIRNGYSDDAEFGSLSSMKIRSHVHDEGTSAGMKFACKVKHNISKLELRQGFEIWKLQPLPQCFKTPAPAECRGMALWPYGAMGYRIKVRRYIGRGATPRKAD